jgi:tRNA(fMet)-specific endonuclease VapC
MWTSPLYKVDIGTPGGGNPIREATRERKKDQMDKMIAAHAVAMGVVLVTNNEKDFASYPG